MPTYQIKSGDTLTKIAAQSGTTVADLLKANPNITNPNLIYAGANLVIPDSAGSSLGKTLPPETPAPTGTPTPDANTGLPTVPTDNLVAFRNLLDVVSKRAAQNAQSNGIGAIGFDPSTVSGGTLAGVLDFVNKQKTQPIQDIYKSTTDFLDKQQKAAQDQITTLISSGAIADLTDSALAKLASASGMDLSTLQAIKQTKKTDKSKPASFSEVTKNGQKVRIGFDAMGNIVNETPLGASTGSDNMSEADRKRQAIKDMDAQITTGTDPKTQGPILGKNGKISPDNWSMAKNAWIQQGYDGADFDTIFGQYQDPNNNNYE